MPRIAGQTQVIQQPPQQSGGPLGIGSLLGALSSFIPGLGQAAAGVSFVETLLGGGDVGQAIQQFQVMAGGGEGGEGEDTETDPSQMTGDTPEKKEDEVADAELTGGVAPGQSQQITHPGPIIPPGMGAEQYYGAQQQMQQPPVSFPPPMFPYGYQGFPMMYGGGMPFGY